jgi:hypothetical protein
MPWTTEAAEGLPSTPRWRIESNHVDHDAHAVAEPARATLPDVTVTVYDGPHGINREHPHRLANKLERSSTPRAGKQVTVVTNDW